MTDNGRLFHVPQETVRQEIWRLHIYGPKYYRCYHYAPLPTPHTARIQWPHLLPDWPLI